MNNLVKYEVLVPLIVSIMVDGKPQVLAMPEGGIIGFDGRAIYSRDTKGNWEQSLTQKRYLLKWMEQGIVQRLKDDKKDTTPTVTNPPAPLQQEAPAPQQGVPAREVEISGEAPILPVVY